MLHSLEQSARSNSLYVNSDKIEVTCFKQDGAIFTLNHKPQTFVDYFIYLGSNILSTEIDVNIGIRKALVAIDHI